MKICCTEVGNDSRLNKFIGNNHGEKYEVQENEMPSEIVQLSTGDFNENSQMLNQTQLRELKEKFNARVTNYALRQKEEIIKDDNQQDVTRG